MKKTLFYTAGFVGLLGLTVLVLYQNKEQEQPVQLSAASLSPNASNSISNSKAQATVIVPLSSGASSIKLDVNSAELKTFSDWIASRGLPIETTLSANGELVSRSAHSGYESSSEASLRQLAASGDKIAAMVLAEKLRKQIREYTVPPSPELKETIELLQMATVRGYTTSIDELVLIKLDQYQKIGMTAHGKTLPSTRTALIEAYEYAYLSKMRGETVPDNLLTIVRRTDDPLSSEEEQLAQKGATALYERMRQERALLGLPPFDNTIPRDVLETIQKLLQYQKQA